MISNLKIIVYVGLLYFCSTQAFESVKDQKTYSFDLVTKHTDNRILVHGKLLSANDNRISYAYCGSKSLSEGVYCNYTVETPGHDQKTCSNIYIAGKDDAEYINRLKYENFFQLQHVNESSLAMLYTFRTTINPERLYKFKFVNMDTCATSDFMFPITDSEYGTFTYNLEIFPNSIELIILTRSTEGIGKKLVRLTHDGKQIGQVRRLPLGEAARIFPADETTPDKGYFEYTHFKENENLDFAIVYLNTTGDSHVVMKPSSQPDVNDYKTFSTAKDLFSYCYIVKPNSKGQGNHVECYQSDQKSMLLNVTFEFEEITNWVGLYNLGVGEILVANGFCRWDEISENNKCDDFKIRTRNNKKESDFKIIAGLELSCKSNKAFETKIYENNKDEVCFSFWCIDFKPNYADHAQDQEIHRYRKSCVQKSDLPKA